jgi:hypothetical protein
MEDAMTNELETKIPQSQSGSGDRYHRWGQLCEILAVIAVAGGFFLAVLEFRSLSWMVIAALLFVGAFVLFRRAIVYAAAAENEVQYIARNTKYAVTPKRIETLEEVGAAKDALNVLRFLPCDKGEFTEDELVGKLADVLGSERANEVKGVILKYTRVDQNKQSADAMSDAKPSDNGKASATMSAT